MGRGESSVHRTGAGLAAAGHPDNRPSGPRPSLTFRDPRDCPLPFPPPSSPATASAPRSSTPRSPSSTRWARPSNGTARSPASAACSRPATRCPPATLDSIRRTRLALKGPLETPSGGGYRSSNVRLREEFQLYANLRPARTVDPGRPLRQHRPGGGAREPRRPLHRPRALRADRRRPARGGHGHRHQHAPGLPPPARIRLRDRRSPPAARRSPWSHKANIMKALTGIFLETGARSSTSASTRARSSSTPSSSTPAR